MAKSNTSMTPEAIEFWFEFGSNYSYLSVMRIEAAAAPLGVQIHWRPFLLGPIFRALGRSTSPFVLEEAKGAYAWTDMERQCSKHHLPWVKPSVFPRTALLPLRVAILAAEQAWMGAYCRRMMSLNFAEDREIDSPEVVADVLGELGLPAQQIVAQAQTDANKMRLRQQTEAAAEKGIFGAPTFFVGGEMYWGNDRLDDALARCVRDQL